MMIWRFTLPQYTGAVLHVFSDEEAWDRTVATEADVDYDWAHPYESANISLVFRIDRLCQARYEAPVAFVCRESAGVVRAWAHAHGIQTRTNAERHYPYFVRPFDPARDTLYIPTAVFGDFLGSSYERAAQPDMIEQMYHENAVSLRRLAVHDVLLRDGHWARDLFKIYSAVDELLVIVHAPYPPDRIDAAAFIEYETLPAGFLWNHHDSRFDAVDQASTPAYAWIPATLLELAGAVTRAPREQFTIQLITVTQVHRMPGSAR